MIAKILDFILKHNPAAWILAGLLVFSFYSNYKTNHKFTYTCWLMEELTSEFSDINMLIAHSKRQAKTIKERYNKENLDKLHKEMDRLLNAHTKEGRHFRANYSRWRELEKLCQERHELVDDFERR